MMEKRIDIDTNSFFFNNVFLDVIKQIKYPKKQSTILVTNVKRSEQLKKIIRDKYKFIFDYPEDNDSVVGIEVFYLGEE